MSSATEGAPPGTRRRQVLLILLAVTSGATDAIGVVSLGGAFTGARIARAPQQGDPVWPRAVTTAIIVEFGIFLAVAAAWWGLGGHPEGVAQPVLLAADAVALGIQSSAILRFGVSGLSTTYMTGTLTTLVSALANGKHPRNVMPSAQILVALIAGAVVAVLLIRYAVALVPLIQLVPVAYVIATVTARP